MSVLAVSPASTSRIFGAEYNDVMDTIYEDTKRGRQKTVTLLYIYYVCTA